MPKLIDLCTDQCRWPIGDPQDPEFTFCGRRKYPGSHYCLQHYAASISAARMNHPGEKERVAAIKAAARAEQEGESSCLEKA